MTIQFTHVYSMYVYVYVELSSRCVCPYRGFPCTDLEGSIHGSMCTYLYICTYMYILVLIEVVTPTHTCMYTGRCMWTLSLGSTWALKGASMYKF